MKFRKLTLIEFLGIGALLLLFGSVLASTLALYPIADYGTAGGVFTYTSGSTAWNLIDEASVNNSDYFQTPNNASGGYYLANFTAPSIASGSSITAVEVCGRYRDNSSGTNAMGSCLRVNGTIYNGTMNNPSTSFTSYCYNWTTNPNTTAAWTLNDVNGNGTAPLTQIGVKGNDWSPAFRVSQLYTDVYYNPSISTLYDNFNDNSLDTANKWVNNGGANIVETNNELELTTTISAGNKDIYSINLYNLTGSAATLKIVDAGNQELSDYVFRFEMQLTTGGGEETGFTIESGTLYFLLFDVKRGNIAFNSANHKYLRIRESGGTIYLDCSSDGISWNNLYSENLSVSGLSVTSLRARILVSDSGSASTTTAKIDSFNILPESSVLDRTKTKLLCHFNGANLATTYTSDDANARVATFAGTAMLSSLQKFGGTTSLLLASLTSSYISFPDSDDWAFGTGDFEWGGRRWFVSLPTSGNSMVLLQQIVDSTHNWSITITESGGAYYLGLNINDSLVTSSDNFALSVNSWVTLAIARSGNDFSFFAGGTKYGTYTHADSIPNIAAPLAIGYFTGSNFFDGYSDEDYIYVGGVLHTQDYEPLDVEYSLSEGATSQQIESAYFDQGFDDGFDDGFN